MAEPQRDDRASGPLTLYVDAFYPSAGGPRSSA